MQGLVDAAQEREALDQLGASDERVLPDHDAHAPVPVPVPDPAAGPVTSPSQTEAGSDQ
jgi:hypothetical protein